MLAVIAVGAEWPEYCGLPMPIPGEVLILEPRHPAAKIYNQEAAKHIELEDESEFEGWIEVNRFYSHNKRSDIVIWRTPEGKTEWGVRPGVHHFDQDISTMGCSVAWSIESEKRALDQLAEYLPHHIFKMYLLTGMFLERSQRSGLCYFFRRLRPTVAVSFATGQTRIIASLCMHPIGYYAGSWAGSMCPTDDVLAHLLLMRADEKMYWRRCNQHPAWHPAAGL